MGGYRCVFYISGVFVLFSRVFRSSFIYFFIWGIIFYISGGRGGGTSGRVSWFSTFSLSFFVFGPSLVSRLGLVAFAVDGPLIQESTIYGGVVCLVRSGRTSGH